MASGHNKLILIIKAVSAGYEAGNFATISINDVKVEVEDANSGNAYRGLHVVVISPSDNYDVIAAKVFDTYRTSEGFEEFIGRETIPDGYIVVAACKDECSVQLSLKAKLWFAEMGSKEVLELGYRQGFAFIGIRGRRKPNEMRSIRAEDQASVTQIFQTNGALTANENAFIIEDPIDVLYDRAHRYQGQAGVQYSWFDESDGNSDDETTNLAWKEKGVKLAKGGKFEVAIEHFLNGLKNVVDVKLEVFILAAIA